MHRAGNKDVWIRHPKSLLNDSYAVSEVDVKSDPIRDTSVYSSNVSSIRKSEIVPGKAKPPPGVGVGVGVAEPPGVVGPLGVVGVLGVVAVVGPLGPLGAVGVNKLFTSAGMQQAAVTLRIR